MSLIELDDKLLAAVEHESDTVDEVNDDRRRLYTATNVGSKRRQNGGSSSSAFVSDESRQCTGDTGLLTGDLSHGCDSRSSHDVESDLVTRAYLYDNSCCWNHPKVRDNWRVVLTSIMLTVVGAGLLIAGVLVELFHTEAEDSAVRGYVFIIAGIICLIPGLYHTVYIYCAVKGARGFSFNNLPMMK